MNLAQTVAQLYQHDLEINPVQDRTFDNRTDLYDHYYSREGLTNNVLCCIGDSWTRGWGLSDYQTQSFGSLVSQQLEWAWLNAGGSGFSNSWQLNNFELITDYLNASSYDSGAVVLTLTENGRDITDYSSRRFDYISAYQLLPNDDQLYELILDDIEREWTERLIDISNRLDTRFKIVVGTNFVTHLHLNQRLDQQTRIQRIQSSWIELLGCPVQTRLISINHLDTVSGILNLSNALGLKHWTVKNSQGAIDIKEYMATNTQYFDPHDQLHPNQAGHRIWAKQIIEVLALHV